MRNLIAQVYCARDRNTHVCALHDAYAYDNDANALIACIGCDNAVVDFAGAGKSLAERGLPRLRNNVDLTAFQDDSDV